MSTIDDERGVRAGLAQPVHVTNASDISSGGGVGGNSTIVNPLGRQPEADGVSVTLSDEDKAVLDAIAAGAGSTITGPLGRQAEGDGVTVTLNTEDEAALDAIPVGIGAPADAEAAGDGSTIAILKRLRTLLSGSLTVIQATAANLNAQVQGGVAHDAVDANNPVKIGGYGSDTPPADVSANADRVNAWLRRNGAVATYPAYGLNITDDIVRALSPGVVVRPTITTTGAGYVSGDVVGGIITLSGVMEASGRQAKLTTLAIKDKDNGAPALNIYFFRATPAAGTYTDNAGLAWGTGDLGNCVGSVQVLSTDYLQDGTSPMAVATIAGLDMLMGSATSDLYCLIISKSSVTITNGNFSAEFAFERM